MLNLPKLYETVQKNCHISDSIYAQDYGLCTYLLKMRELYRWEKKLSFTAKLPQQDLGEWLMAREQLWETVAQEPFTDLPIADQYYDPFNSTAINQVLLPQKLVYSGGYGYFCKPIFFLGRLQQHNWQEGLEIFIVADEYVRELTAPPAMSQGSTIFIRQEAVQRTVWETLEGWQWQKTENHFTKLLETYHVHQDLEAALAKITQDKIESLINHEIGEVYAHHLLGEDWENMLIELSGSKAELFARAVRDNLADCLVTLPRLIELTSTTTLLLYFANFKGIRKTLFPALIKAYQQWLTDNNNLTLLKQVIEEGQNHWLNTAQSLLTWYQKNPQESVKRIVEQIEQHRF